MCWCERCECVSSIKFFIQPLHSQIHPKGPMRTNLATKSLPTNKQRQKLRRQMRALHTFAPRRPVLRIAHTFHNTHRNPRPSARFELSAPHRIQLAGRQCVKQTIVLPLTALACVRLTLNGLVDSNLHAMTGSEARRCLRPDLRLAARFTAAAYSDFAA